MVEDKKFLGDCDWQEDCPRLKEQPEKVKE
jgi:hypothetical protein